MNALLQQITNHATARTAWLISICLFYGCRPAHAQVIITEKFLDAVAMVESSGNPNAIGDNGKALGLFQLHRAAWEDALKNDSSLGAHQTGALNPAKARRAARIYFQILAARYQARTRTSPTSGQLYAAYNCGLSRFLSAYGGDVTKAPATTRRAIKKLEGML